MKIKAVTHKPVVQKERRKNFTTTTEGTGKIWFRERTPLLASSKFEAQRKVEDNARMPPSIYSYDPVWQGRSHKCLVMINPKAHAALK